MDTNLKHKRFFLKVLKCNFKWPSSKDGIVKFPTFYHILSNVTITLSIYILCLSVYPFFVRLYPINVKTAETIGPKFCGGPHPREGLLEKKILENSWSFYENAPKLEMQQLKLLKIFTGKGALKSRIIYSVIFMYLTCVYI